MYSNLVKGRIDRRAFVVAAGVATITLLVVLFIILVPVAMIGIVAPKVGDSFIIKGFTVIAGAAILIPYLVIMASLLIRRVHDFGGRGSLWIIGIVLALILERMLDIGQFRLIALLAILAVCVMPGNKVRNFYGGKPNKKFKADFERWYNY